MHRKTNFLVNLYLDNKYSDSDIKLLGLSLSYEYFVTIEGSQIITFLAYQLLTLPLRLTLYPPTLLLAHDFIIIIIIIDQFYIVLFSALEQTHCAHVACDSQ